MDPEKRRRGKLTGKNGELMSAILRHRHMLLRAENGLTKSVVKPIRAARDEIRLRLLQLATRENAGESISELRRQSLRDLEEQFDVLIAVAEVESTDALRAGLRQFADAETAFQTGLLERLLPAGLDLNLQGVDIGRLAAIIDQPIGGKMWAERMRRNFGDTLPAMRRSLATSVALGEGVVPAARRLEKAIDKLTIQRATLIVRSEVQRVANQTARDIYQQNPSVLKGIQIVETLDGRTCLICMGKDGQVFPLGAGENLLPIYHARCRGFVSPVTKSFEEMGIEANEFAPAVRASMDGEVAGPVTYPEWFAGQNDTFQRNVLGGPRFDRFKSGDLDLKDMVRDQRILSINELPETSLSMV